MPLPSPSPLPSAKEVVRRFFAEAVDQHDVTILGDLFTADCIIHRPEASRPISGLEGIRRIVGAGAKLYSHVATTVHDLIAEGDRVACRLSHRATFSGEWRTRLGNQAVAGRTISWEAMAIFRLRDGKIAEQWVCRDELGMLLQLGVLQRSSDEAG
ncbi:MAG: ester cyclase [Candidatus Tectomicrobia bacterium]|nr:ester cyclase [Candidatus Tectomicrobia bacterium]